ncbi:3-oxoacyl-[acyl-carrier-protein] synthase III C-terminal domain-containing protein [Streptomyces sp. AS02]|uniref:3-oxoacyl-[acyl-carrier-protein] synthase III C-terminal domain-containing protein n=1 Tax=Streptomyces sp. AS02 TaxID=2938946 RepID=UPI002021DDD8|nr:3-oxoacyl-[acyl-carrier-protein] synthase III C-terminal domain-containing protein [Streptomyces sp. AS02]MCL8015538.1 3-oxoacyl-ACP synthase [Streptomyces sp. AS02]
MKGKWPIALEAAAIWTPEGRETVAAMVAAGRITAEEGEGLGLTAVPVADVPAPDMAVRAAERALEAAGRGARDIGLVAHGWLYHQGHDFWSPAHYIADRIGARTAFPVGVQQLSNAGAAAIGIAVDKLAADARLTAALVTTADRFCPPGFDRWAADYGVVYGDAGTAVLLRRYDPARSRAALLLRSLTFVTAAEYESMYRGRDAFSPAPLWHGGRVDVRRPKKAYLEMRGGIAQFSESARECVRSVLLQALAEAGVEPQDPRIRCVALPRLSDGVLEMMYLPVLDGLVSGGVLRERENSGHLGAGDMLANLAHISANSELHPGDFAVVIGGGGGFTWSCAVVEAVQSPASF